MKRRIGTISFLKKKQRIWSETKDRNYFFLKETKDLVWNERSELFFFLKRSDLFLYLIRNEVSGLKRRIGTISFFKKETKYRD